MSIVIAAASTKGGVGKTTLTICTAVEFKALGHRVAVVDADPNEPVVAWSQKGAEPEITVRGGMTVDSFMPTIRALKADHDVILVDLQGAASELMLLAFGRADFVLIPAKASEFDVREAAKTLAAVERAGEMVDRKITARVVLTMTPPAIRTRATKNARETFLQAGIPLLDVELMERTAFKEMTFTGIAPNSVDTNSNAAHNVRAIVAEILHAMAAPDEEPAPAIHFPTRKAEVAPATVTPEKVG